jgi:chaperonin cofactor prefoldin
MYKHYKTIGDVISFSFILFKENQEKQAEFISRAIALCKKHEEKFNEKFDENKFKEYVSTRIEYYENQHKDKTD